MLTDEQLAQIYTNAFEFDEVPDPAEVCGLIGHIRTLQQKNRQVIEALIKIANSRQGAYEATTGEGHAECVKIAHKTLQSIQGGTSNGTS